MDGVWDIATPAQVIEARLEACRRGVTARLRRSDRIGGAWSSWRALPRTAALAACDDSGGRPLFAGHAALPWPDEPHLVLWHAQTLLRELPRRRSCRAVAADGLSGVEALVVARRDRRVPDLPLQSSQGMARRRLGRGGRRSAAARRSRRRRPSSPKRAGLAGSASRTRPTRSRRPRTRACPTTTRRQLVQLGRRFSRMVIDAGLLPMGARDANGRRRGPVAFACAEAALVPARPAATRATCCPAPTIRTAGRPTLAYLAQVATACDALGFDGMLTPCGTGCEDAWLATASLHPAHPPGEVPRRVPARPALADAGRADGIDLPTALGRPPARQHRDRRRTGRARPLRRLGGQGDALRAHRRVRRDHAGRVERRAVRLRRARTTTSTAATTRHAARTGARASTSAARPKRPNASRPSTSTCTSRGANRPRWWRSASTACAASPRPRAASLDFGIRFHVIARPTADEAWAAADALRARMEPDAIAAAQADFATTQSVGQQRMASLHGGDADDLRRVPERVGRHRARARRRRHRARRVVRRGRRSHRRVPRARLRRVHPLRLSRTSKRRTGSAKA